MPNTLSTLSVAIIAKNESANLRDCLASVQWANELIVVDSGSTDDTVAIARSMGARVIQTLDWPGFGPQKNRALAEAACEWVLTIDADERVTPALQTALQAAMCTGGYQAFASPRLTYFLGQPVRHCGWYPDPAVRLFRRGRARFSDHLVHEGLLVDDPVQMLSADLLHFSYRTVGDVQRKVMSYGRAGAQELVKRGKRPWPTTPVLKAAWAWLRTFLFKGGFLDGLAGWRIASMNARTTYLKYSNARVLVAARQFV
jgi:glycosyltransferase involved in cell wall biosynthesis